VKKIFFDLKSWGPLKHFTRSGPYLGLDLSIEVKKRNENLADCPFKDNFSICGKDQCTSVLYLKYTAERLHRYSNEKVVANRDDDDKGRDGDR
jgi:hypothetical protein